MMRERSAHRLISIDGKIIGRGINIDCVIRDISEDDAVVSTAMPADVSGKIYLWERSTTAIFECDIRWQSKSSLFALDFSDDGGKARRRALVEKVLNEPQPQERRRSRSESFHTNVAA